MRRCQVELKKILFFYATQLCSYVRCSINVQLIAPQYVKQHHTANLYCNHTALETNLRKVDFIKDGKKILEYIKDRNPPFIEHPLNGAHLKYTPDGRRIDLLDMQFEASGKYWCDVSTVTPIYTKESNTVQLKVIAPQKEDPWITFKKRVYTVGEYLEANCSSSAAYPVPHITWLINGKEVNSPLVTHYPQVDHKRNLKSAMARLKIEVSELHAGDSGYLEISCQATIPSFPIYRGQYADQRYKTVQVEIIPAPVAVSATKGQTQQLLLLAVSSSLSICLKSRMVPQLK